jgi:DNA-binding IclR family transcriptional regulator
MKLVHKDEADDRYHWNPLWWMLIARGPRAAAARLDLVHAMLQDLVNVSGQTAILSVPDMRQRSMIQVACVVPESPMRVDLRGRPAAPLHALAAGKCYLSTLSPAAVADYLKQDLVSLTPHTVTAAEPLLAQLELARTHGYAVAREEYVLGATSIAIPIRDEYGATVGTLSLIGPLAHFTRERIAGWLPLVRSTAGQLLQALHPGAGPMLPPAAESMEGSAKEGVSQNGTRFRKNYRIL